MARPRLQPDQTATRERLLAAAETVFGQEGVAAAKLEQIAAGAGISRPSLLYHFDSKEQLYAAVIASAFGKLASALGPPLRGGASFRERLDAAVSAYVGFLDAHPNVARLVLRELIDGRGPGRALILSAAVPLLARVERFLRRAGRGHLLPGLPVREALMDVVFGGMVRAASGELRVPLFGARDRRAALIHCLLLRED